MNVVAASVYRWRGGLRCLYVVHCCSIRLPLCGYFAVHDVCIVCNGLFREYFGLSNMFSCFAYSMSSAARACCDMVCLCFDATTCLRTNLLWMHVRMICIMILLFSILLRELCYERLRATYNVAWRATVFVSCALLCARVSCRSADVLLSIVHEFYVNGLFREYSGLYVFILHSVLRRNPVWCCLLRMHAVPLLFEATTYLRTNLFWINIWMICVLWAFLHRSQGVLNNIKPPIFQV